MQSNVVRAEAFDLVWSWGVIHHSSRTGRIVRQIARVLQPQGEARVMVYNRHALSSFLSVVRDSALSRRPLQGSIVGVPSRAPRVFCPLLRQEHSRTLSCFFRDVTFSAMWEYADVFLFPEPVILCCRSCPRRT